MIFTWTPQIKAFIEFQNVEAAVIAKETIHGTNVDDYGKTRVYYSNHNGIVCSNNFVNYWEADT